MAFRDFELGGKIACVTSRKNGGRREGPGACEACGLPAAYLCDHTDAGRPGRCDRALCGQCRRPQSPRTAERDGIDFCPAHAADARARYEASRREAGRPPAGDANADWGIAAEADCDF